MNERKFACVIMAAGLGKRMKSDLPKVLHKLNGRALIEYVVDTAKSCGAEKVILIVGYKRELVEGLLNGQLQFAVQEQQLGTGHAVKQTEPLLKDYTGSILILSGDVPLLTVETVNRLIDHHFAEKNACTLLTCIFEDPTGYGRIKRGKNNSVTAIVEHKDASAEELQIQEINSGIYVVERAILFKALNSLKNNNRQKEFYLTDIVPFILGKGLRVGGLALDDPLEIAGINSQEELVKLEKVYLRRKKDLI